MLLLEEREKKEREKEEKLRKAASHANVKGIFGKLF